VTILSLFLYLGVVGRYFDTTSFHWIQKQQQQKKRRREETMNHSAGNYEMSCVRFPPNVSVNIQTVDLKSLLFFFAPIPLNNQICFSV
jgi:hypothetical protein